MLVLFFGNLHESARVAPVDLTYTTVRKLLFGLKAPNVVVYRPESDIEMLVTLAVEADAQHRILFIELEWRRDQVSRKRFNIDHSHGVFDFECGVLHDFSF